MDPKYFLNKTNLSNSDDYPSLEALGPEMQVVLIIVYSLTALLALSGNVTVVGVLALGKRSSRDLRIFLINLAVSDITMASFSIPFTYTDFMLGRWIFDPHFCPFVLFMQHSSVIVSVYTLTAVGLDRYYAVIYPLRKGWTKSRGLFILVVIWVVAFGFSSVQLIQSRAEKFRWAGEDYYECQETWDEESGKIYTVTVFIVTFVLPLVVMTFTYSSIGWKMWKHNAPGNADVTRDERHLKTKFKTVKMLLLVLILFSLCWLPIQIFNLLVYFDPEFLIFTNDDEYYKFVGTFFFCHWISMANSFVNPIIYCFMSENFRVDLKQLVFYHCRRKSRQKKDVVPLVPLRGRSSAYSSTLLITCGSNVTDVMVLKSNTAERGRKRVSSLDSKSRILLVTKGETDNTFGPARTPSTSDMGSRSLSSVSV
ncbi:probable G-protein coupled receptor 83 [Limulus polyphemus]|uniref:Probable G-protein coupled receptor 83 n=1 Tax=Limulus polyphemus TaxID=6850 RepID=A0ABM1T349_LIMPO|nr:probable G-protein coupled receptor 83 [Limulus polyphemus]